MPVADIEKSCKWAKKLLGDNTILELIVDLRETPTDYTDAHVTYIKTVITQLSQLGFSRTTLASGAYPIDIKVGQSRLPRHDRILWERVNSELQGHDLGYADYTVVSPAWQEGPMIRRGKVAIRYALNDEWLVLKGDDGTKAESLRLSQLMLSLFKKDFRGAGYSFGDELIANRADPGLPLSDKKGGGETHLLEGVNHHITLVVKEH